MILYFLFQVSEHLLAYIYWPMLIYMVRIKYVYYKLKERVIFNLRARVRVRISF